MKREMLLLLATGLVALGAWSAIDAGPAAARGYYAYHRHARLSEAAREFRHGVEKRNDAASARPEFAKAALLYDRLWNPDPADGDLFAPPRNPAIALNRARAHRLAGDLPRSILALHDGLALNRSDRELQDALAEARSAVAYPAEGAAALGRPAVPVTIGSRLSPRETAILAGALWILACLAITRFLMTRTHLGLLIAAGSITALAVLAGLWWHDARVRERLEAHPLAVVAEDTLLRKGNAVSYLPRLEVRLPRGLEVRVLHERGGWLQVELPSGTVGWLPGSALVR